jgi:crossover junction endodeoxyribonuclease RuvC
MKILAMDLSLSCPAFSVVTVEKGVPSVVHLSHLKTKASKSHGYRLFEIYNHLQKIFDEHDDLDEVVREKGFSRFPLATQTLFKVVGISDVCALRNGFDTVTEYAPTTVKKTISGSGKGTKEDVARCLAIYVGTDIKYKTDDESDSVAVALTHLIKKKALV